MGCVELEKYYLFYGIKRFDKEIMKFSLKIQMILSKSGNGEVILFIVSLMIFKLFLKFGNLEISCFIM